MFLNDKEYGNSSIVGLFHCIVPTLHQVPGTRYQFERKVASGVEPALCSGKAPQCTMKMYLFDSIFTIQYKKRMNIVENMECEWFWVDVLWYVFVCSFVLFFSSVQMMFTLWSGGVISGLDGSMTVRWHMVWFKAVLCGFSFSISCQISVYTCNFSYVANASRGYLSLWFRNVNK